VVPTPILIRGQEVPTRVEFRCRCSDCLITVSVRNGPSFVCRGSKRVSLAEGKHRLYWKAVGAPRAKVGIAISQGGSMDPITDQTGSDGKGAGQRGFVVGTVATRRRPSAAARLKR
jgi:hypothetical protein